MLQGHEMLEQAGERLTNSWHDVEYGTGFIRMYLEG